MIQPNELKLYKVKHKESGLYWKGGGMNKNKGSLYHVRGKYDCKIDYNSEEHALEVCFSKTGKTWSTLGAVKSALCYGHERGLNSLLSKCSLVELTVIEKQLS